jgi:hypothetical protein
MLLSIRTAPFNIDIELAVIDGEGSHALMFACRRALGGWLKAETGETIAVRPTGSPRSRRSWRQFWYAHRSAPRRNLASCMRSRGRRLCREPIDVGLRPTRRPAAIAAILHWINGSICRIAVAKIISAYGELLNEPDRRLVGLMQVGDQVLDFLLVFHPGEDHLGAGDRDRRPRLVTGADVRNSPLFARAQIRFLSDRLIDLESQRSRLTAAHSFADGCENEARSCLLLRTRTIAEIYELSDRTAFLGRNRPRHLRRMAEGYPAGRRRFTVLARSVLPVDVLVLRLPHVGRSP